MAKRGNRGFFGTLLRWTLTLFLLFLGISVLQVVLLKVVNPPCTLMTAWGWVESIFFQKPGPPRIYWRSLNEISPHMRRAVLAGEDQRFLNHMGFDFDEIKDAVEDMFSGEHIRGASTITMQAARTVFLWPDRNWVRKALEAYYTILMEVFWGKRRILEIYLNTVDWGRGIMGVEAASIRYFNVPASRITRIQAARLAAILPSPHRWSPTKPNAHVLRREKRILKDMGKMPLIS
ncbi:MAG: monofunctional biosynthetic peptidoglycan transglycosylase [Deltaproteobacteria bacterium]